LNLKIQFFFSQSLWCCNIETIKTLIQLLFLFISIIIEL